MKTTNWGRWGETDERGALNLLNPEVVKQATGLVKRGEVFSLAIPLAQRGQPVASVRNPNLHLMSLDGGDFAAGVRLPGGYQAADDYLIMSTHGTTHADGLAHAWYGDKLYNGHDPKRVRSYGATRCGIEKMGWIVSRGVLLDVAGSKNVENLPMSYTITREDLEECCAVQGITVQAADTVLIRTGWLNVFYRDPKEFDAGQPGVGLAAAEWLLARDICAVAADNTAVEIKIGEKFENEAEAPPVHKLLIRDNGIYMMELFNLEGIAQAKAYEFLFIAAPLRIVGGVGSPLNPLAIV